MKKLYTILFSLISFCSLAQTASQDFGTGTGTWNTSNTSSAAWLPNPLVSGTSWGRISNAQGGDIDLTNPGLAVLGTGSEVRASASSGASVVKFSPMVTYTVGNQFYTKFDVLFGDVSGGNTATSGEWSFYQGTTIGGFYADGADYAANKVFTGLRWTYGASGALTFEYLNTSTWTAVSTFQTQGNKYTIEIIGSNSGGTINYTYGTAQSVPDNMYDVWVNGVRVLNDVNKGQASNGATVDAITFIGKNSTSNEANIFVDDFTTYNTIAAVPPITPSCLTPTTDASALTFSAITTNSATANWTNGNGTNRIVVAKQNATIGGTPTDLSSYTGNATFGSGATIAASEYVVSNGFNSSINVTNLTGGASYNFKIFEYNCNSGNELYLTPTPASANLLVPPNIPGSFTAACSDLATNNVTLTWNTPAGFYDNILIFARATSNPAHNPTGAGSGYTGANSNITLSSTWGATDKLVYAGTGNTVTVSGLTPGLTYNFRAYTYVVSTYSVATATMSSFVGAQNISSPAVVISNGTLGFTWTNPACYDSIFVVATDNGVNPTVVPTGNGSLYFDNFFYGDPASEANMPINEYCVYKGTGTAFTLFGLTNTVLYRLKIFVRRGTTWSTGVLISGTPTVSVGDYMSNGTGGGNWKDYLIWNRWNGAAWIPATSGQFPNTPTGSATIVSGDVILVSNANPNGAPYSFYNLDIQAGGKVYVGNNTTNTYLEMFNQIICNGTFGNGVTPDALSLNAEGLSTGCAIGGTGSFTVSRLRKNLNLNAITKLNINMDINLTYSPGPTAYLNTVIYNNRNATRFDIVINTGSVVSTPATTGNVSFDGINGNDAGATQRGTMTVFGTLNVGGIYYMKTNNSLVANTVSLTIKNGGVVNIKTVDAALSGAAKHTLTIESGGLLNLNGVAAFSAFDVTNNVFNCNAGSTFEYSAAGDQTIESGINYHHLKGSVSGNKTPNGNLTVNGSLTVDAAIFNINTSLKTLTLGNTGALQYGHLTLQNGGTMSENCKTLLNIVASSSFIQTFTGNNQLIKCLNLTSVKSIGASSLVFAAPAGNSDIYIRNDLMLDHSGATVVTDNGNTLNIGDDAQIGGVSSASTNYNLTGTLKFVCLGAAAATDIHLSDLAGTGLTVARPYSITVDAEAGSLINAVQIYPVAGGQTLIMNGSLAIQNTNALNNLLNPNNNNISIKGNWSTYNQAGFTEGITQVTLSGTALQTFTGAETFYNLELNNSNNAALNNNLIVTNELKLTNGHITTGANELQVTNNAIASVIGSSNASWVAGNLRRTVAATGNYDFPVGDAANYQLANVLLNSSTGMSTILAFFNTTITGTAPSYPTTTINGDGIFGILNTGFWTITPNAYTAVNYDVTLNQRGYSNFSGNANQLGVIKRANSGANWGGTTLVGTNGFHNNATQSIGGGTAIAKRTGVTSFSDFALGFGGVPLPVQLSSFTATVVDNKQVDLFWNTQAEINCDYFSIQRSVNGVDFTEIGKVNGNGTSEISHDYNFIDQSPLCAIGYYRLMQVDNNSETYYSQIVAANVNCVAVVSAYPNPTSDYLLVDLSSFKNVISSIKITGIDGKIYDEFEYSTTLLKYDVSKFSSGFYFININNGEQHLKTSFIKD